MREEVTGMVTSAGAALVDGGLVEIEGAVIAILSPVGDRAENICTARFGDTVAVFAGSLRNQAQLVAAHHPGQASHHLSLTVTRGAAEASGAAAAQNSDLPSPNAAEMVRASRQAVEKSTCLHVIQQPTSALKSPWTAGDPLLQRPGPFHAGSPAGSLQVGSWLWPELHV